MTDNHQNRFHRYGARALSVIALLFIGGVLILWSWNIVAVEHFQAPVIRFKHALAYEMFALVVFSIYYYVGRFFTGKQSGSEELNCKVQ